MKKRNVYAVTVAFCLFSAALGSSVLAAGGTRHLVGIGEGGTSVAEPETTVGDAEKSTEAATEATTASEETTEVTTEAN